MTLKIIRGSMPRNAVQKIPFMDPLVDVDRLEILNLYQYDAHSQFSLQRIRFKPNRIADLNKILREELYAEYYEVLSQQNDEILCITKQKQNIVFYPFLTQGPAAMLCPIIMQEDLIQFQCMAEEQHLARLFESLSKFTDSWKVTSMSNVEGMKELDQFGQLRMPAPSFTAKQRDIATYAAQHGYFKSPKQISGQTIAKHFGITESAVNINLKNAKNLAMTFFFGGI